MKILGNLKSDSSGQTIVLAGFVIAVIIVGMGSVLYSAASSGHQKTPLQTDVSFDYFDNIRKEYGIAMMVSSDEGELDPFNISHSVLPQFEDKMKTIVESHGYIVNFSWVNGSYSNETKRASVNILFSDGNKLFNDTVTYNLITGKMLYDTIPPGDITDLTIYVFSDVCNPFDGGIGLNWTAVGDDGYEEGSAYFYDIRYIAGQDKINNWSDFKNATRYTYLIESPKLNGSNEFYAIESVFNPKESDNWTIAIVVYDESGLHSNISNIVNVSKDDISYWTPVISNVYANNESTNGTYYNFDAKLGDNITIAFNVTDYDDDNVSVTLYVRNWTLLPNGSRDYGEWYPDGVWNKIPSEYNYEYYTYTNITNITKSWDYYFNVSDDSGCSYKVGIFPTGAPDRNQYSIEIPPKEYIKETIVINSTDNISDAYIDASPLEKDNPHNGDMISIDDDKYPKRGLIWFNLSSIPDNAYIDYAILSLYTINSTGDPIDIHRVINDSWDETTVAFKDGIVFENSNSTSSIPIVNNFINWTITGDVQYYYNNPTQNFGWILKYYSEDSSDQMSNFSSKQVSDSSLHPVLYIGYSV
jgi:hypothetical protein